MDPLGAALAVLAVALYPGALYLLTMGRAGAALAGLPTGPSPTAAGILAVVAACAAAALLPLPASPAAVLPPDGGAAPDLIVVGILAGVAVAAPPGIPWNRRRCVAVVAALVALLALPVAAGSLSLEAIDAVPGPGMTAARWLAAAAVLSAAPLAAGIHAGGPRLVRSSVMAMLVLLGLSLLVPPGLAGRGALAGAAAVSGALLLHATLLRPGRRVVARAAGPVVGLGVVLAAAAVTVAEVVAR